MTEQELLQAIAELQAECVNKDSQILDMQFKIKDLEYQIKMLNNLLNLKKTWRDFDVDGRC
jgi:peptidoglycan hydrolase CwlO-like protein